MAYQSPAPTGLYLSNFLEAYLRSRQLGNQERQQSQGEIVNALHGMDLLKEQQVGQDIESLIRTRQQPPMPGAAALAPQAGLAGPPPVAPGLAAGALGTPTIPEGIQVPQPGGRVGALLEAGGAPTARPAPFEAVTQGLPPAAVARLLTTGRGQTALKTFEQAERDRRDQEDLSAAQGHFEEAATAAKAGDPMAWADKYAAGLRRIKQFGPSATIQEYAIKLREDKDERGKASTYFKVVAEADQAYEKDPSPENYQKFLGAVTTANESKVGQAFAQKVMENMVSKRLSMDPAEHFFFSAVARGYMEAYQQNKAPDERAIWRGALEKNPAGFARLLQQYAMDPKKSNLPDFVLEMLRLPPAAKDEKAILFTTAVAKVNQMPQVQAGQVKRNSPEYWALVIQEKGRLTELGEGPTKHSVNVLREEALRYEKGVREGTIPVDLKAARLLLDQITTALKGGELDPDSEADLRRIQPGLIAAIEAAAKRSGIKVQPKEGPAGVPSRQPGKPLTTQQQTLRVRRDALVQGNFPGKTWATLTPEEKQTIADLIEDQTRP